MLSIRNCEFCGLCDKLSSCSKCKGVYYCCKDHQISGWKNQRNHSIKTAVSKFHSLSDIIQNPKGYIDGQLSTPCYNKYCLTNRFIESRRIDGKSTVQINSSYSNVNDDKFTDAKIVNGSNNKINDNAVMNKVVNKKGFGDFTGLKPMITSSENSGKGSNDESYDFLADFCYEVLNKSSIMDDDRVLDDICRDVVKDLDRYGVYVVDNFLGIEKGTEVLKEVQELHSKGAFQDGQLLNYKKDRDSRTIRSDRIAWVDSKRVDCVSINGLIKRVDKIVMKSNRMANNGEMGKCKIDGRTKAMVACYPAGGSQYVKHVDNPNQDGRRITVIYYLNQNWNSRKDGGLLRIFPAGWKDSVADIEPVFDRLLFFWSDRRNPHEVQPAFRSRYAITLWYFDAEERKQATLRNKSCVPTPTRLNNSTCNQQTLIV